MKKTIISIVVSLALLMGAFAVMSVAPTAAENGVDFLEKGALTVSNESIHANVENGVLTFNAKAYDEVYLVVETPANLNDYPFVELDLTSTGKFDLCFYDANNNKWMFGAGDFCWAFVGNTGASNPLPRGDHNVKIDITSAYTWDGSKLPANAAIVRIGFIAKEAGTITVRKAQITDGVSDVNIDSRGDQSQTHWDNRVDLIAGNYTDCPAPADNPISSVKVTKNADGSVTYGNTAALYPAAVYDFSANPIVVYDSAALDLDFTVSANTKTAIYLFMGDVNDGGSTAAEFGNGTYIWIADPADILNAELGEGHYSGTIFLQDTIRKTVGNLDNVDKLMNKDGKFVINSIKIFATSTDSVAANNVVTFNKCDLVWFKNDPLPPVTTIATTTQPIPDGLVYTCSETAVTVTDYNGTAASLDIPSVIEGLPVTEIASEAFRNCDTLTDVLLPNTLQTIGTRAFYSCDSLEIMDIPDNVTFLGDNAFYGCKSLTHIRLGRYIRTVPASAFYLCSSLSSVELPAGLTNINSMAFQGCSSLSDVLFGGSEEQWQLVSIASSGNKVLSAADITFDCAPDSTQPSVIWGDINSDGVTDLLDAAQLFYYLNGKIVW